MDCLKNRTVLLTGATGGIGAAAAHLFARNGARLIFPVRNVSRGEELVHAIRTETPKARLSIYPMDLADPISIVKFVDRLREDCLLPDTLINNAGVMCDRFRTSAYGCEYTVGINYLATILLTEKILPLMPRDRRCDIITTVSVTRKIGRIDRAFFDNDPTQFSRFGAYSRSKLALTLYTAELATRLGESPIRVNAVDPGVVDTGMITMHRWFDPLADLLFRPFIKSPQRAAQTLIDMLIVDRHAHLFYGKHNCKLSAEAYTHPLHHWLNEQTLSRLSCFFAEPSAPNTPQSLEPEHP